MVRHYKTLFSESGALHPIFCCDRAEKISGEDATMVEKDLPGGDLDAVRGAEASGFLPIALLGATINIIVKVLAERIKRVVGKVVGMCKMLLSKGGEWNKENAKELMCILKCFEEVSGLRFNYNKSKLYVVRANEVELRNMARWMRCGIGEFPFTYLGLLIGENMRRVRSIEYRGGEVKNPFVRIEATSLSFGEA
ncbi:hypothetical protein Tco_0585057 [Tanacetum coccineum]